MPALKINDEILYESAVVATFLADAFPHLTFYPASSGSGGAMQRARAGFFVDTFMGKVNSLSMGVLKAGSGGEEQEKLGRELVGVVEREIEGLLDGAAPFWGGKGELGLVEVSRRAVFTIPLA